MCNAWKINIYVQPNLIKGPFGPYCEGEEMDGGAMRKVQRQILFSRLNNILN